jgi:hypothetical protein
MSNLALAFIQRQTRPVRSRLSSTSTVSSHEAEENIRQHRVTFEEEQRQGNALQGSVFNAAATKNDISVSLNSCGDVTVGDRITNVYQSFYAKVMYRPNNLITIHS